MVGPWSLPPHHDYLQYIHHIHLMQQVQNWGVTTMHLQINVHDLENIMNLEGVKIWMNETM